MAFDFACPDWEEKLRRGEAPIAALPVNKARATRAVNFFNGLQLPDVPGQPRLAEAAGDWFRDIVRASFGSEDPETGLPLVNEVFALVPKKNSKTTYSAALGLTALLLWERPNAQMLILGPTQNVAQRCFDQAHGMIKANPKLAAIFHVQEHLKTITRIKTGATLAVKTFDMGVVTGEIPALTIIDELHIIAARSYADRVIAQITGGMVTNPHALLVYITTQSDVPPMGVFKTKLEFARGIRDGQITEGVRMLPVLYEFPERIQLAKDKPWRDPALWPMVTPNLGLSVNLPILKDQYAARRQEGIEAEIIWASQHLNIQIGMGLHNDRWIGADHWEEAVLPGLTLAELIRRSEVCVAGIDGGGMDDLLGLTVLGRERHTRRWLSWSKAWVHPVALERRKKIAPILRDFEKAGEMVICETPTQDVEELVALVGDLHRAGVLPQKAAVGLDPEGVAAIVDALELDGIPTEMLVPVSQGYRLNGAIKGTERKLYDGSMKHAEQALMTWCVGNAKTEMKGNAVVVTKAVSGSGKIDPLMALFNAVWLMSLNPTAPARMDDYFAALEAST
ncbi:terminase large subunit [Salipiger bermudensis]|uniref:terminase large subunit n=1 Tax=Salipiger bermudensis TaxID=344736 RepID=UPI001CD266E5|nr:terminase TerL endonuclease subunit [Salipiger bermudensis]MCA0963231.1 terminase large subunit [Salipiger bermudensis]